jgi:hypothetical protein
MPQRRTSPPRRRRLVEALIRIQQSQGLTDAAFAAVIEVGRDRAGQPVYLTQSYWTRLRNGTARLTWEVAESLIRAYPECAGEAFTDFWGGLVGDVA